MSDGSILSIAVEPPPILEFVQLTCCFWTMVTLQLWVKPKTISEDIKPTDVFRDYVNANEICQHIFEPVSVKTGLNDIKMKIQVTTLRESINLSECFLKI